MSFSSPSAPAHEFSLSWRFGQDCPVLFQGTFEWVVRFTRKRRSESCPFFLLPKFLESGSYLNVFLSVTCWFVKVISFEANFQLLKSFRLEMNNLVFFFLTCLYSHRKKNFYIGRLSCVILLGNLCKICLHQRLLSLSPSLFYNASQESFVAMVTPPIDSQLTTSWSSFQSSLWETKLSVSENLDGTWRFQFHTFRWISTFCFYLTFRVDNINHNASLSLISFPAKMTTFC